MSSSSSLQGSSALTRREFLKAGAGASLGLLVSSCSKGEAKEQLSIYNWPYYMSGRVLREFEKKFNVSVVHQTFDSGSDEELPDLLAREHAFDIVVPGGAILQELIRGGLLQKLDHSRLSRLENILPQFKELYDPANQYSVPYMWCTMGVGVNMTKLPRAEPTWGLLWEKEHANRIAMIDSPWEAFAATLKSLGYSGTQPDAGELERARERLLEQRELAPMFTDQIVGLLSSSKVWLGQGYNGDVLQARKLDRSIAYFVPREGTLKYLDSMCIPNGARHVDLAHEFMNYILDGQVSAAISNEIWYAGPNGAAYKHIFPEILKDPAVFPRGETLDRCEWERHESRVEDAIMPWWKEIHPE